MLFFTGIALEPEKLLTGLLLFIIVSFTEEIAFRGYILHNLMQSMNKWYALVLSSIPFALVHIQNPGVAEANYIPIIYIFFAGLLLGINYLYTKNLWFGIALHFSWNFFQGPILGYDVSGFSSAALLQQTQKGPALLTGGEFGFEGSVLCLALSVLAIFLLSSYYSKQQQPTTVEI
jgi:membrane protease YdiL (CAAX protease family)